jgi:hypothetical protein
VGEVGVERAVEGEVSGVVGDGAVDGAVGDGDVFLCEAGEKFLEVADSLGASCWVTVAVVVVVGHIECVFKASPLVCGEEVTEVGHAEEAMF